MPATTTTSKTTTTVKQTNLTAAAKDDSFLAQSTGATEDNSVRLSVLANDPGAAKLYSVWQVPEGTSSSTQVQVMTTSTLKSGAVIAINADGTISYDPRNAFQSLAEGELATDTFTYTGRMANGTLSTANVSVQVLGKNDVATISGISTGAVTEDAGGTASGKLAVADVDHGEAGFRTASGLDGTYGTFSFNQGAWTFAADNSRNAVQALAAGETATQSLTVTSIDGTATQAINVTITGVNDAASISGDSTGEVTEDAGGSASGTLAVSDVDHGEAGFRETSGLDGTYGKFSFNQGAWTFAADNSREAVQALAAGKTATQSLTVTSLDGTATQDIVVTVTGVNDEASISGAASETINEDQSSVSGSLAVSDIDDGENIFSSETSSLGGRYGSFTFDQGVWSFSPNARAQSLAAGSSATEKLTVTSKDGTASEHIVVTITGENDIATIAGDAEAELTEDGTATVRGSLSVSDVDFNEDTFSLVADAALAGRYGTFSFNSRNGNWSYTQGDTSAQAAHVQALNTGEVGVDELEVSSLDGTASVTIRVKVNGLDEPKVDLPQKKEQTVEAPKTIPDNKPIVELPKTTFTISMDQFNTSRTQTITGFNENSVLDVPNELNYRGAKVVSNDLDLSFKQGNDAYAVILVGVTSIDDTTKDGTPSQIV